ncbi:MAG: serine--tRNA ligase [Candidatus Moeniiplasma glomeromycotorum]|nr:serine--tRNA ligase [Candidatus Moeniiplasma glomeromycotorum]MCE8167312.1 serine--tRNA ligase [Candidatus Moeniiplasma glomeromycotorum]MCE8168674.1 serine--tRNA ligase [Candidatus Moeniiplasma glomeromycotorum]
MLDLKKFFATEADFEHLVESLKQRQIDRNHLLFIRQKWEATRKLKKDIEQLCQKRNQLEGPQNAEKVREVKVEITNRENNFNNLSQELNDLIEKLPNLPAPDTPSTNRIIAEAKYPPNFQSPLTHEKVLLKLGLIDEEKSILLSGSKFVVYQGWGSQLLHALINFMRSENNRRGYRLFDTPYLVKEVNLYHTGQLPKFQDEVYKLTQSQFYLISTAEISLVNLYQGKILLETELPLNLCAYSPCFRKEAGAGGQENKGLIRLHQFHKVELVKIVRPENSYLELEKLVEDACHLLHLLKISHRIVELGKQELGFSATKTYDIEVWLPVSQKWLEISSCSNCEDFQSRRAQIRVKKKDGTKYLPHTLNGSALAIDRLILTLCEYYYNQAENRLEIPEILKKYFF